MQAVVRTEFQQASLVAKADTADLRARILESEVEVAGLRGAEVGDFTFDPDIRKCSFEDGADLVGELADFPDAASEAADRRVRSGSWISAAEEIDDPENQCERERSAGCR